ncbi:MAG TPA: hypothetical protein VLA43_01310, partial [Longimicrobiales bacterium]|nr:hypothetical protein [Longimicrobiales bacterium]
DLVKALEGGADVVAGSAPEAGPEVPRPFRWGRRLAPWVLGRVYRTSPVPDPLCGVRAYRVIVIKKCLREDDGPLAAAPESWVANLELLRRVVAYARRVEAVPLTLRYHLLARESRFKATQTLKRLFALRSGAWPEPGEAARKPREEAA